MAGIHTPTITLILLLEPAFPSTPKIITINSSSSSSVLALPLVAPLSLLPSQYSSQIPSMLSTFLPPTLLHPILHPALSQNARNPSCREYVRCAMLQMFP
jgi:hypothetical protein